MPEVSHHVHIGAYVVRSIWSLVKIQFDDFDDPPSCHDDPGCHDEIWLLRRILTGIRESTSSWRCNLSTWTSTAARSSETRTQQLDRLLPGSQHDSHRFNGITCLVTTPVTIPGASPVTSAVTSPSLARLTCDLIGWTRRFLFSALHQAGPVEGHMEGLPRWTRLS